MSFDPTVPAKLRKTQKWFAGIITRPIDEDSRMNPISPSGVPMEEEAWDYIQPSPTLRPAQRIQIYNQQYWWRLLKTLQETFPLLTRLFGYHDFNQLIAIPYLVKYPPNHWSLNFLGDRLPRWVSEDYHASDKKLIQDAADMEWAFGHSFCAKQLPPIQLGALPKEDDVSSLLTPPLYLQPHIHLFAFDYDLFLFRSEFMKQEPEYWVENDFPPLPKEQKHFVLFRNHRHDVVYNEVTAGEFQLLQQFKQGSSVDEACQWLERQEGGIYGEASRHIHTWFQEWMMRQWLSLEKPGTQPQMFC